MITRGHDPPIAAHLHTPSPEPSLRGSLISSDGDTDLSDAVDMALSPDDLPAAAGPLSGPMSLSQTSLQPTGPYCPRIPTLQEILTNRAPPPWTLAAFTQHLSQNHCLENLEFIKAAERYRNKYATLASAAGGPPRSPPSPASLDVHAIWVRLLDAYIRPNAPREVNLPADVREPLLAMHYPDTPPPPRVLDPAIERIVELMNESILLTFISEHTPQRPASTGVVDEPPSPEDRRHTRHSSEQHRHERSRSRNSPVGDVRAAVSHHRHHTTGNARPLAHLRPTIHLHHPSAGGTGDESARTDDTASSGSPTQSPMTPPTTPPSSDLGSTSPRARTGNSWANLVKRMQTGGRRR